LSFWLLVTHSAILLYLSIDAVASRTGNENGNQCDKIKDTKLTMISFHTAEVHKMKSDGPGDKDDSKTPYTRPAGCESEQYEQGTDAIA